MRDLSNSTRRRTLNGNHGRTKCFIRKIQIVIGQPLKNLLPIAGVYDHQMRSVLRMAGEAIDQHVVENSPLVVSHETVTHLPRLHVGHAASDNAVKKRRSVFTKKSKPAHVRNIEQSGGRARSVVLGNNRRILHRHRPTGKIDHPPMGYMPIVQRRFRKRAGHISGSRRRCLRR